MDKTINNKRILWLLLKILLFSTVIYVFYKQIQRIDFKEIETISVVHVVSLILAIVLVFFNLGVEFWKWKEVLNLSKIASSFNIQLKSFLAGIVTGLITPNTIGNFIGRIFYFRRRDRVSLILLTFISNMSQFFASVFFGIFSILLFGFAKIELEDSDFGTKIFVLFFLLIVFIFFFRFEKIQFNFVQNNRLIHRIKPLLVSNKTFRIKLLALSILRHVIFSFQFWLLLHAFGIDVDWFWLGMIWQVFFFTTLIPSFWFGKLLIRESIALLILSPLTSKPELILICSVFLWFINQGIPSLIGIPFLKFKKYRHV